MSFRITKAPFFDLRSLPFLQRVLSIPCRHPLMPPFQKLSVNLTVVTAILTVAGADSFQGTEEKVGCFDNC